MQPKCAYSQACSQPAGRCAGSNARSAEPVKKYCGGDSWWTIASSGGASTTWAKRRSRPAAVDLSMISRPNRSLPTEPPQPVRTPSVAATRATFQHAPPATLRQLSGPVRTKSVSASPNTTSLGKAPPPSGATAQASVGTAAGSARAAPIIPAFISSP